MEIPKLSILLCCLTYAVASHNSHHTIPIEGYESHLQDLGQHVEIPETPVKIIKITKTVAVKIPVPYPVKIREKVPYPVHVAKPYPVPVPQIIKVPHVASPKASHEHDAGFGGNIHGAQEGLNYQVQESEPSSGGYSFGPIAGNHAFEGSNSGSSHNFDGDFSYEGTPGTYESNGNHGYSGSISSAGDDESKSYDQAINNYFNNKQQSGDVSGYSPYH